MNETLRKLVERRTPVLAEGSIYELLRRDPRIEFDPHIAHAGLIYEDEPGRRLAALHGAYRDIAARHRLPFLALTDTWRASASRVARSRFSGRPVNADNVAFLRRVAGERAFVAGLTGPAGDAYLPVEAPSEAEARTYHAAQIRDLADAGVDVLYASTLPSTAEAAGIGVLMADSGLPWMLSFVVRRDGTVLDGVSLSDAIGRIDDLTRGTALGYAVNCVHASTAMEALETLGAAASRLIAFQGNASRLTPEELDGRSEIDSEPAPAYADGVFELAAAAGLPIAGGCCGTSPAHLEELAMRLARNGVSPAAPRG